MQTLIHGASLALTSLSEQEGMFQEAVRDFAVSEVAPRAMAMDQAQQMEQGLIDQLFELGLMGIEIPEVYGGTGADFFTSVLVVEELSKADPAIGVLVDVQNTLVVNALRRWGSEDQKARFYPKLASDTVGAYALSEAGSGSDAFALSCRATRDGDDWLLNGHKMWITNCDEAYVLVVYAKTDPERGSRGITAFLVEKGFEGFSVAQKLDKLGMRGSPTGELRFEDCEVPEENVLGDENGGARILMSGLDYERVVLAAGPLGLMQACMDLVVPYVHERKQFGQPIGSFQLMQGKLADMYTGLNACKAYVYTVAKACDRGETTRKDAAGAILYASEKATWMALQAIQALGGNGYTNDYPAGRYLRDAKLYEIGAGTSEIRRMLIGREIFDETA